MKRNTIIIGISVAVAMIGGLVSTVPVLAKSCGGVETSYIDCGGQTGEGAIIGIIKIALGVMTGAVGIAAVGAVVYGGILYSLASDSPDKIRKAREIWTNVVIGLLLFGFMVAITNFLIPGGIFS